MRSDIGDFLTPFSSAIIAKRIDFQIEVDIPYTYSAYIDKSLYLSILYNLVENGIKFNKLDGKLKIKISV